MGRAAGCFFLSRSQGKEGGGSSELGRVHVQNRQIDKRPRDGSGDWVVRGVGRARLRLSVQIRALCWGELCATTGTAKE
jgi:hypothetical protein